MGSPFSTPSSLDCHLGLYCTARGDVARIRRVPRIHTCVHQGCSHQLLQVHTTGNSSSRLDTLSSLTLAGLSRPMEVTGREGVVGSVD